MLSLKSLLILLIPLTSVHGRHSHSTTTDTTISEETRAHWMRTANAALSQIRSPCPFGAFGTAIVNHTDHSSPSGALGRLMCLGVNDVASGNPVLHGEVAAINNCTSIFRASRSEGGLGLSGSEAGMAWRDLSLYTNGEPCPMVWQKLFLVPNMIQY